MERWQVSVQTISFLAVPCVRHVRMWFLGNGFLGSWGPGVLGSLGLVSWGLGVLGSWGLGEWGPGVLGPWGGHGVLGSWGLGSWGPVVLCWVVRRGLVRRGFVPQSRLKVLAPSFSTQASTCAQHAAQKDCSKRGPLIYYL